MSILNHFEDVFEEDKKEMGLKEGSEDWDDFFETQSYVYMIILNYKSDIWNVLRQKINQSLIVQTDNAVISTDPKNQSTEGNAVKRKSGTTVHKMQWMGSEKQLITLFEMLMKKHLINIDENRKWKILAEHFINKKGDAFKHRQLSTVAQKTSQDEGEVIQLVDKIAKEPSE